VHKKAISLSHPHPHPLFTIECNSGRYIHRHSYVEKENEVLLLPATQLEVVACLNPSHDFHIIQLREVDPSSPPLERLPGHPSLVAGSPAIEPPKKFLSTIRNMPLLKTMTLSRTPENYQNLKLEKRIAKYEPHSMIDLDRQSLTDQDMLIVVQQAVINKQCTMLRLSDNKITSQGVSILAAALRNNRTLEGLYIFNNRVGDTSVYSLAQVLAENNSTLRTLSLGWNGIIDEGTDHLAEILKKIEH
jgi:hypothetical protein